MTKKNGFTLVELMVVVAIVALLSAVALPMFSGFKQRSQVSTAIKSCTGLVSAFQDWYAETNSFSNISVPTTGGTVLYNSRVYLGVGLPEISNLEWTISTITTSVVRVNWHFVSSCPNSICDGYYEISCSHETDKCYVRIRLDDANTLDMNRG